MSEKIPSAKEVLIKGSFIHNPILIQCAGLCPVVAAAASLKNAALLAAAVSITTLITCIIASALLKKVQRWIRMGIYLIIGIAIICPVLFLLETRSDAELPLVMKIYLPLIAVNSVTAVHCEQFSVRNPVKLAFYDSVAVSIGSSAVLLICGAIREIIGYSSIAGHELKLHATIRGAALPFGCFIILGFLAAILKWISAYRYPSLVPDSEAIVRTKPKKEDGEGTVEVDVFDEFWNESSKTDLAADGYDELFDSLDNIFDFNGGEDEK